jgi:hypothetical protein
MTEKSPMLRLAKARSQRNYSLLVAQRLPTITERNPRLLLPYVDVRSSETERCCHLSPERSRLGCNPT